MKTIKEVEHEEAPSGYVKMYNYKEPFMKFNEGYGYQGVLLFDGETDKVQCHFCGEWFGQLAHHLHREHNMTASAYKDSVGLMQTTALIGEKMREKLVASGMEKRLKNLKIQGRKSEETKRKIRETQKKNVIEKRNLNGTCPEQLIERFLKIYNKLGRVPRTKEKGFSGLYKTLCFYYGNMKRVCQLAGVKYRKSGETLKSFKELHGRTPSPSDIKRQLVF